MSYTGVLAITPGEGYQKIENLHNSSGSALQIWDRLSRVHLDRSWRNESSGDFWKLVNDVRVPVEARALLAFTFDRCYVERAHYAHMAKCIHTYLKWYPIPETHANHWPRIAEILETVDCPAVGLHVTSVTDNPFSGGWDAETDEPLPFDWSTSYSLFARYPELLDASP